MTTPIHRSSSLKFIVAVKGLKALVLAIVSIVSAFSWRHYDELATFAQDYLVNGEFSLIDWGLQSILNAQPHDLKLIARISGFYAVVLGIGSVGLWYAKKWANPMMIVMVALPLPFEIRELIHDPSPKVILIFLLNLSVLALLVKHQFTPEPEAEGQLEESTSG
jgi:uncharacterized membrane protein (DUF2068 family)